MAVRMIIGKDRAFDGDTLRSNVEVVSDFYGSETWRINHRYECPHKSDAAYIKERGPECPEGCQYHSPLYIETTYEGAVLDTYERNGHDDSDFYAICWDEAEGKVVHIEYATTRGWTYACSAKIDATEDVVAAATTWKRQVTAEAVTRKDERRVVEPEEGDMVKGVRVRLLANHKNAEKECDEAPCPKCEGTGQWINPRNKNDVRQCFGCRGTKTIKVNWRNAKDAKGKGKWKHFAAGLTGEVYKTTTFGFNYNAKYNMYNPYGNTNHPREQVSVRVKFDDGSWGTIPLTKLRLDREPVTLDEALESMGSHVGWRDYVL